jgi:hypothetical protein
MFQLVHQVHCSTKTYFLFLPQKAHSYRYGQMRLAASGTSHENYVRMGFQKFPVVQTDYQGGILRPDFAGFEIELFQFFLRGQFSLPQPVTQLTSRTFHGLRFQ